MNKFLFVLLSAVLCVTSAGMAGCKKEPEDKRQHVKMRVYTDVSGDETGALSEMICEFSEEDNVKEITMPCDGESRRLYVKMLFPDGKEVMGHGNESIIPRLESFINQLGEKENIDYMLYPGTYEWSFRMFNSNELAFYYKARLTVHIVLKGEKS